MIALDSIPPQFVCVPVERIGNRFQCSSVAAPWSSLPTVGELRHYLSTSFDILHDLVDYRGTLLQTTVLIPLHQDTSTFYIIVDPSSGEPLGEHERAAQEEDVYSDSSVWRTFAIRLETRLRPSECISPFEQTDIARDFLQPRMRPITALGSNTSVGHRISWIDYQRRSRTVLLGPPGAGKTTCLRRVAIERARSAQGDSVIPLYWSMRHWTRDTRILDALQRSASQDADHVFANTIPDLCAKGRAMLLLDGLDEVPEDFRDTARKQVVDLAATFSKISIHVTCRDSSYKWWFHDFNHFIIEPFSVPQVREWSHAKLAARGTYKEFDRNILARQDILALLTSPLVLSLAVTSFADNRAPEANTARLVARLIDALVDQWDHVRGITRSSVWWASPEMKRSLLTRLGEKLSGLAGHFLPSNTPLALGRLFGFSELPPDSLLQMLYEQTGLVRPKAGSWHFTSDLLRQFLTAQYLAHSSQDAVNIIKPRIGAEEWQRVWVLMCGLVPDASQLISELRATCTIDPMRRAKLLAQCVATASVVSESVALESLTDVLDALESSLDGLELKEDQSVGKDRIVFRAASHGALDHCYSEPAKQLRASCRAMRRTTLGAEFLRLARERNAVVGRVSELLMTDGQFRDYRFGRELMLLLDRFDCADGGPSEMPTTERPVSWSPWTDQME